MKAPSGNGGAPRSTQSSRELRVEPRVGAEVGGAELAPAARGRPAGYPENTGGMPGSWISSGLQETIRAQGWPARVNRGEADDVVLDDQRGLQLVEDLPQAIVDVGGAVAEGAERRLDERLELLDRRRPEDGRRLADEVLPELARRLLDLGRRPEPHQPLLEALRLEAACERFLDDEHDPMPALAQNLADPDAVVRRAVGPLGKEDDGGGVAHGQRGCADPCGTVRVRRLAEVDWWGAKLRDPRGEVKAPRPLAEALVSALRPELERARWYQGKGGRLGSLRLRRRRSTSRAPTVGCSRSSPPRTRRQHDRIRDGGPRRAGRDLAEAPPTDPLWAALARLAADGGSVEGEHGILEGEPGSRAEGVDWSVCRPLEADQSNTSVVVDDRVVLKLYRLLREGVHPEQELLAGLTRVGSSGRRRSRGRFATAAAMPSAALATAYALRRRDAGRLGARDRRAGDRPRRPGGGARPPRWSRRLSSAAVPASSIATCSRPSAVSSQRGSAAAAERERATGGLDEAVDVTRSLAPELADLVPAARAALEGLARLEGTLLQRIHGDLHVAQLVRTDTGVVAIDFEGDPTLPTEARRRPASPLQDLASLLLSLDHVAAAAARRRGFGAATERGVRVERAGARRRARRIRDTAPPGRHPRPGPPPRRRGRQGVA